ncbi:hypothetical protein [Geodermatophilus sp. SYSU D01105]
MSGPQETDGDAVRVPTEQVDGVIDLRDVVDRVRDGAAARAARAGDGAGTRDDRDALTRISELAAQLSEELARLGPLDP